MFLRPEFLKILGINNKYKCNMWLRQKSFEFRKISSLSADMCQILRVVYVTLWERATKRLKEGK